MTVLGINYATTVIINLNHRGDKVNPFQNPGIKNAAYPKAFGMGFDV
jgi:hypothetical protein